MEIDKIAGALAKAQAEITCPGRNREVKVRTRDGGSYGFKYSTLDNIIEHVRQPLAANGLWFTQILEGDEAGKYRLVTRLMHESGQFIESRTPLLVSGADNQQFGSALTYMRRYSLSAMLGLAADEDDDANAADGNEIAESKDRKPAAKKPGAKSEKKTEPKKVIDQPEGYEKIMGEGLTYVSKVMTAQDADSMLNIIRTTKHVGDSEKDLKKALADRTRLMGLTFNKDTGKFEVHDADQSQQGDRGNQDDQTGTQETA